MASNFPQFFNPMLTELTSQPGQGFDAFDVSGFCPIVHVDPKDSRGILLVDRAVLESTESTRDLSRAPGGEHPIINLANPSTVSYECTENASPAQWYDPVDLDRAQDPLQFRERIARNVMQAALQTVYADVASMYTTAGNWTNNAAITALGGSGVVLSDLTDGDIITDIQVAVEKYQDANGQMDPKHLVINRRAIQYGTRQAKTRAALPDNTLRREGYLALVSHIESVTGLKVHVQTAARNNALMWGASMILLPEHGSSLMMDGGARIDPTAGALICEDFSFAPGDHYIKEWERDDGNRRFIAAVKSYVAKVVDNEAAYLVTGLY